MTHVFGRTRFALTLLGVGVVAVLACERNQPEAPTLAPIPESEPMSNTERDDITNTQLDALALRCEGPSLREHLATQTPAQLDAMVDAGATSLGLLASWERGRKFDADGVLEQASVDQLAAQLEAALGHAPPRWWLEQLASGRLREGDEAGPPYYEVGLGDGGDRRGPWAQGPGGVRVRVGTGGVLSAANGVLSFDLSMGRVELGPLPTEPGAMIEVARARAGTTIYWASFSPGSGGVRFPLHAIDSDGGVRWQAEVCGPDRKELGGHGYLSVEIIVLESPPPDPDSRTMPGSAATVTGVAVYSAESHGLALDVFDPQTGARTLAWSSDFWFAR